MKPQVYRFDPGTSVRVIYEDRTPFGSPVTDRPDESTRTLFRPVLDRLRRSGPSDMAEWGPQIVEQLLASGLLDDAGVPDGAGAWAIREDVAFPDVDLAQPVAIVVSCADRGVMTRVDVPRGGWRQLREMTGSLATEGLTHERMAHGPLAAVLHELATGAMVTTTPSPPLSLPPGFTFVGHNTVLCASSTTRVLTDPLFFAHSMHHPNRYQPITPTELGSVDAVVITHSHPDHFDPGSLLRLSPDTLVIVPRVDRETVLTVDMALRLREFGHERIVELGWGERYVIGDIEIAVLPFRGEQPTSGTVLHPEIRNAGNTYVLTSPEWRAAFLADSGRDHSGDVRAEASAFRCAHGRADVVFCGYRGWRTYPAQLLGSSVARYCLFVPPWEWGCRQQLMSDAADAVDVAERFGASTLVPYGDGGAPWHWNVGLGHRVGPATEEDRFFDPLPERVVRAAAHRLASPDGDVVRSNVDVVVLRPGESLTGSPRKHRVERHPRHMWPYPEFTTF